MINYFRIKNNKGVSIVEILIVISIIIAIGAIVALNLSKFRDEQALKNTTVDIVTLLNKARQNTLSSLNSNNYSVHFESDKAVLFSGTTYSSSSSDNDPIIFSSAVTIPATGGINISGGGSDINFKRLTGDVINGTISSTIIIELVSNPSRQKTITINKTGIISSN
jgi:type II secretory pathway pseudopilin PulG